MSVFCFKDGMLAVDGLEVNARAKSINVSYGAEPLDVTVFGSETGKAHVNMSGLFEWGIEAEGFLNPTATLASDIDAQLYRMIGQRNRSARVPPAVPLFESSFADDPAVPLWLIDVGVFSDRVVARRRPDRRRRGRHHHVAIGRVRWFRPHRRGRCHGDQADQRQERARGRAI